MKKNILYIIPPEFTGSADILTSSGRVAYTDRWIGEYLIENPSSRIVTESEMAVIYEKYIRGMVTQPRKITKTRYVEMLNILPPARYGITRGIEHFHCPERITGPLVSWFARIGWDEFYEWEDVCFEATSEIVRKVATAAGLEG